MITATISPKEIARYAKLETEIARLTSALEVAVRGLEHYADDANWAENYLSQIVYREDSILVAGSDVARQTLAEIKGKRNNAD